MKIATEEKSEDAGEPDKIGLGGRLKHERKIRGASMKEVSDATGVNVFTISRIEMGYKCFYRTAVILIKWIEYL